MGTLLADSQLSNFTFYRQAIEAIAKIIEGNKRARNHRSLLNED